MDGLWADATEERASSEPAFNVDVNGFEGPLDLLLHLARNQKVDLARISVLALTEQYLAISSPVSPSGPTCLGISRRDFR